jgi:3-hydroxyisobutyrate dehydrogenase-like beta-hydroxyacid dehydrogenase
VKPPAVVAVLGLGEAGRAIADDLVGQGVTVHGWDPDASRSLAASPLEAVAGAHVVLSVNAHAIAAAESVAGSLGAAQLYADLNTSSAEVKRRVAAVIAPAEFVDVALLAPVPITGVRTPCLASGPGAARFAEIFGPLGMPVEVVADAATQKLIRSVFMKGIAAAAIESLSAAERAGCEPWLRAQLESVLDAALVDRLVEGSRIHARRRVEEMEAAAAVVSELGLEPHVARAAAEVLRALAGPA